VPKYAYRAKRGPKEVVEGILEAETVDRVVARLSDQGFVPIQVTPAPAEAEVSPPVVRSTHLPPPRASLEADVPPPKVARPAGGHGGRVRPQEVTFFTRQMAGLFRSRIPVLQALELIQSQAERPAFRWMVEQIAESVRQGKPLSEAFGQLPRLFPSLYCSLVQAGEVSGQMEGMLFRLLEHREKEESLQAKVQLATVYPFFLLMMGIATIMVLLIVVIPRLGTLFEDLHQTLPWPTRWVMEASRFLSETWWIGLSVAMGGWALATRRTDRGGGLLDRLPLLIPLWRRFLFRVEVARFCRTLGVLLDSGVPILQAVAVAVPTVENRRVRSELAQIEGPLAAGTPLSRCLQRVPAFSAFVRGVIAIGEGSGNLPHHLLEIASSLEDEVERSLRVMTTLLEPSLILILGAVVGVIVAAMLLPIFEIGSGMHIN
jgi:type II secretory pathway component PulF